MNMEKNEILKFIEENPEEIIEAIKQYMFNKDLPHKAYEKTKSVYDKFLELRAAHVQAVSLAWSDDSLRKEYKKDPPAFMAKYLNYDFPFNINLQVDERNDTWSSEKTGGWVGINNVYEMVIPPRPKRGQEGLALADYHRNHLTFLAGNKQG